MTQAPRRRWRLALRWPFDRRTAAPLMVAVVGLLLVAVLVPQERSLDPNELTALHARHPSLMAALEAMGATRVAGSPALYTGMLLLVLGLAVDTARRAWALPGRLARGGGPLPAAAILRAQGHRVVATPVAEPLREVERALRRRGFHVRASADGVRGERGRSGAIGSVVFHGGLVALAMGALWSTATRMHGVVALGEGQPFDGSLGGSWSTVSPAGIPEAELPPVRFTVGKLAVSFDEAGTLLDARVPLVTPDGVEHTVAVNEPLRAGGAAVRLADYGLAPLFVVREPATRLERGAAVKLQVMPAGRTDSFAFPDLDRRFEVRMYPDAVRAGGELTSASAALRAPVALLSIEGAPEPPVELPRGGSVQLAGLQVTMPEVYYWVRLEVDRDPARGLVFAALLLSFFGLTWRLMLPWVRVDAAAVDGGVALACRGEGVAGGSPKRYDALMRALTDGLKPPGTRS